MPGSLPQQQPPLLLPTWRRLCLAEPGWPPCACLSVCPDEGVAAGSLSSPLQPAGAWRAGERAAAVTDSPQKLVLRLPWLAGSSCKASEPAREREPGERTKIRIDGQPRSSGWKAAATTSTGDRVVGSLCSVGPMESGNNQHDWPARPGKQRRRDTSDWGPSSGELTLGCGRALAGSTSDWRLRMASGAQE